MSGSQLKKEYYPLSGYSNELNKFEWKLEKQPSNYTPLMWETQLSNFNLALNSSASFASSKLILFYLDATEQ